MDHWSRHSRGRRLQCYLRSAAQEAEVRKTDRSIAVSQTVQEKNKALALEAFDTLFNRRDYKAAEQYWSYPGPPFSSAQDIESPAATASSI